jgi:hypothetical protein
MPFSDADINWGFGDASPLTDVATVIAFLNNIPAVKQELFDWLKANVFTQYVFQARLRTLTGGYVVQELQAQAAQTSAEDGTDMVPTTIEPGAPYQQAYTGETAPAIDTVNKIGIYTVITRERVMAEQVDAVNFAFRQLSNAYSDGSDATSIATITAKVAQTIAGTTITGTSTYNEMVQPLLNAQTVLFNNRRGFKGNAFILPASIAALYAGNAAVQTILALEQDKSASVYTGSLGKLGGVDIIAVPDSLCTGTAFATGGLLVDTTAFGGLAEQIPLTSDVVYLDSSRTPSDSWWVSLNHNFKAYVKSPGAACFVTGLVA